MLHLEIYDGNKTRFYTSKFAVLDMGQKLLLVSL